MQNDTGKNTADTPEQLDTEDFNQIDPNVLDCFPESRIPVDLYHWQESSGMLKHVYKRGSDLDATTRASFRQLSEDGSLFFSRRQIDDYTESVACDLQTALNDPNLAWKQKAVVFIHVLSQAQQELFSHPKPAQLEQLITATDSFCAHLIENNRRIDKVVHELHKDISPERRRIHASIMGIALYLEMHKGSILAETLNNVALGFIVYDIGMAHVSPMMISKPQQLTTMDQRSLRVHPKKGLDILEKLGIQQPEILEPALQHHERLNGSGYPDKLTGDRIGQLGRIAAVSDTYAAMITDRPQRKGVPPIKAATELIENEDLYDRFICRTLIHFLKNIPA